MHISTGATLSAESKGRCIHPLLGGAFVHLSAQKSADLRFGAAAAPLCDRVHTVFAHVQQHSRGRAIAVGAAVPRPPPRRFARVAAGEAPPPPVAVHRASPFWVSHFHFFDRVMRPLYPSGVAAL